MNCFFYHFCERDSPSYGTSEQNEETGGFLSKTATSYVLLAKQGSVFIPGEKGHSLLVAFLAGVRKGRKRVIIKCDYVQKKYFYSCSSPNNKFFLKLPAFSCCFHCNIIS